jgi:hypothetical protein
MSAAPRQKAEERLLLEWCRSQGVVLDGVRLDGRYGGYREWRGLVHAIDAQVELEREGRHAIKMTHLAVPLDDSATSKS